MAIAELMAAGAVPIVFDGGGLREIVEHERNGYRWRTLDELCEYTMSLVRNGRRRVRFAAAAQQRAELWSLGHYQRRILAMTRDLIASRKQRLIAR
jgi:glycosyltransferase involved in cell wall biosynthesis